MCAPLYASKYLKSKSSKMKLTGLHYISDKTHNDSKLWQKMIVFKVQTILYINYHSAMFKL